MRTSSKYFKRWFRTLSLSYEEVAESLDVHPITVRNWEKRGASRVVKLAFDHVYRPYVRPEWRHKPRARRGRLGP